jgi:dihydroorotase-like cyclic amidohydrolase
LIRVAELASVIDPNREQIVTREVLRSAQDFTPFTGMRVHGWPSG